VLSALATLAGVAATDAQTTPPATAPEVQEVARPELLPLETFDAAWSLIDRTHFDPDFNGVDWAAVRDELRPRAAAATSRGALRSVIREMIGRLGQSHFALLPQEVVDAAPEEILEDTEDDAPADPSEASDDPDNRTTPGRAGAEAERADADEFDDEQGDDDRGDVGFDVRLIDDRMVVTDVAADGPAAAAGIQRGWVLVAVNDLRPDEAIDSLESELDPRMASYQAWQIIQGWLAGPAGRTVRLTMLDGQDQDHDIALKRRPEPGEVIQFGNLPPIQVYLESRVVAPSGAGPAVGVIRFNMWLGPTVKWIDEAIETMRHVDGIILDLRGNPGGVGAMVMGVSGHFIDERIPIGVMKTRGTELKFLVNPRRVSVHREPVRPFAGPVAILVDGQTASTSEIFAGGMQALGRARVFGERSVGAALPAAMDRLPNGDVLLHAFADFLTADGVSLEARGVIPDEAVPRTRADLLAGHDAAMDAAVSWIGRETD
jgi:carboxyl-terminal processing protease